MTPHEPERDPRERPYEPPAIEELEAGSDPAVTAAGASGMDDTLPPGAE